MAGFKDFLQVIESLPRTVICCKKRLRRETKDWFERGLLPFVTEICYEQKSRVLIKMPLVGPVTTQATLSNLITVVPHGYPFHGPRFSVETHYEPPDWILQLLAHRLGDDPIVCIREFLTGTQTNGLKKFLYQQHLSSRTGKEIQVMKEFETCQSPYFWSPAQKLLNQWQESNRLLGEVGYRVGGI